MLPNFPTITYYKTLYFTLSMLLPMTVPHLLWNESYWMVFWGQFIFRSVTLHNLTWLVNSAAHLYGTRPYNRKIQPVESAIVSFFTFGEGWHNYHHTFPWDYRAAEFGQKFDITTCWIDFFAKLGWVYDRKQAPQSMVIRWAKTQGDGTHPVYGVEVAETRADSDTSMAPAIQADVNIQKEVMSDSFYYRNSPNNAIKVR